MTYTRKEVIGDCTLYQGDCLEVLPTLEPVDAIITDPPYGKVKGDFDHAWTNRQAMLKDADLWIAAMVERIKFNGSLWWFAWPSLAGRIEALIAARMNVLSHIVWKKPTATGLKARKEALRAPMPLTERILFAEHYGADAEACGQAGYKSKCNEAAQRVFGRYISAIRANNRISAKALTEAVGAYGNVNHGGACSNWERGYNVPTREQYQKIQITWPGAFEREYEDLRREYEDLRREYEDLRREYEDLRRYFDVRATDQFGDIWEFSTDAQRHGHPTQKPVDLMQYIVRLSVRPQGVALDPFMGSGTTGVACVNLGRKFTGIELEPKYFDIACKRIEEAYKQPRLFDEPAPKPIQEKLFGEGA